MLARVVAGDANRVAPGSAAIRRTSVLHRRNCSRHAQGAEQVSVYLHAQGHAHEQHHRRAPVIEDAILFVVRIVSINNRSVRNCSDRRPMLVHGAVAIEVDPRHSWNAVAVVILTATAIVHRPNAEASPRSPKRVDATWASSANVVAQRHTLATTWKSSADGIMAVRGPGRLR